MFPAIPPMPPVNLPSIEESVTVDQNVTIYASSGGSVVSSGGSVREGTSSVRAEVQTVLNGEKVVDITRSETATGSVSLEIRAATKVSSSSGATSSVTVRKEVPAVVKSSRVKKFFSYVFSLFQF